MQYVYVEPPEKESGKLYVIDSKRIKMTKISKG